MAVYSYTTATTSPQISQYSSSTISVFANYIVSEFGTKGNNLFKIFSSSDQLEETTTYSFNSSSYNLFETEDYGFISQIFEDTTDNGTISELHSETIQYGLITSSETRIPYGTIKVSRIAAITEFNLRVIGGVEFHLQGGSYESFGVPFIGYDLVSVSGRATESTAPATHVSSGRIFAFVSSTESNTESYLQRTELFKLSGESTEKNTESYVGSGTFSTFISSTESFGQNPSENTALFKISGLLVERNTESYVGSGSLFTFGSGAESTTYSPETKVLFKLFGSATESTTPATEVGSGSLFGFSSTTESFGPNPPENTALFNISGAASNLKNTESYVGSGVLFAVTSFDESITYSYNESAQVSYITFDRGFIAESTIDPDEDYGFISESDAFEINEDFGQITFDIEAPVYGTVSISGISTPNFRLRHIGSGSLFGFSSTTESFGPNPPENTALFKLTGSLIEKNSESYKSTEGRLKLSSELSLTFIIAVSVGGNINIEGSLTSEKNTESYIGSGSLFAFSSTTESFGSNPPETTALFKISGAATESTTPATEVGSGSLFNFVRKDERRTYSYNNSSSIESSNEDYEYIFNPHIDQDDYGFITELPFTRPREDYGLITTSVKKPFGLFSINGSAQENNSESYIGYENINVSGSGSSPLAVQLPPFIVEARFSGAATNIKNTESYVGSGSLFTFVSKTEVNSFAPPASGLFKISGSAIEKNTEVHVGSGSLFGFSSTTESFGPNPPENTALFKLTGSLVERNTESYVGSGSLFTFVSKTEITSFAPPASGLFKISGSAVEKNTEDYVGSGSLFAFSSATVATLLSPITSGLFIIIGSATESTTPATEVGSGSLFTFVSKIESFGPNPPETTALFKISGAATDIKNTEAYRGSGSLFGFSSTTESRLVAPPANGLFRISGSAAESTTPTTEIGSGIFQISQKVVKLDAKNKVRLVGAFESRSSTPKIFGCDVKFYGSVFLYFEYRETGVGQLTLAGQAQIQTNPVHVGSGKIQTGANAYPVRYVLSEVGSGSLFTFVSKTESTGSNPPENIALFKISGAATDIKNTEAYRGSGSENISGKALSIFKLRHIGSGSTRFSGNGIEKNTEVHTGLGSLFGFSSTTESFGPNPPENIALFKISGAATNIKNTEAYRGSGSLFTFVSKIESVAYSPETKVLFNIVGSAKESDTEVHVSSGSLFGFSSTTDSFGPNPPENTALFKISGSATDIKNTESYVGSGSLFTFVSKTESVAYSPETKVLFNIVGSAEESDTEVHAGSGSLFGFSSTTESFGSNPPESTALFRISGAAKEKLVTGTYIGSGSLFTFVSKTESVVYSPETKVLFNIVGSAIEKNTESYVGFGSLFGFSSTTESFGSNPPENTALFKFTGSATESITPTSEVGSGSLFTFVSKTESVVYSPETKVLFNIFGSAYIVATNSYDGSGSLFGLSGSSSSFIFRYSIQQKLFRIFGIKEESFAKGLYTGSAETFVRGKSTDSKVNYVPPKPSRIYVI